MRRNYYFVVAFGSFTGIKEIENSPRNINVTLLKKAIRSIAYDKSMTVALRKKLIATTLISESGSH